MNYIVTPLEMQNAENEAFKNGLSPYIAMERAGACVFHEAEAFKKVLVVANSGNNGGDGFVCARLLKKAGASVHVLFVGEKEKLSDHALRFFNEITDLIITSPENDYDLIIDALFGIGFKGTLQGKYLDAARLINSYKPKAKVLSVDIPSGLNGLTGEAEYAVEADITVTFGAKKLGLIINRGADFSGEIKVKDIGIYPASQIIEPDLPVLKKMKNTAHKGTMGHGGFICGSFGMEGAAMLAASSALKSGMGKVSLAVSEDIKNNFLCRAPEVMVTLRNKEFLNNKDVIVFGCGVGRNEDNRRLLDEIIENCTCTLIIDADGLYYLTKEHLKKAKCPVLLTPHMAEASHLMGCDISELILKPAEKIKEFSRETGASVLLKSNYNMLAVNGEIFLTAYGTKGMATAGSGDVLAGILSACVHITGSIKEGALLGAYIHGTAGVFSENKFSSYSMTAGDIRDNIYKVFKMLEG